jgi:hypothetical protein
VDVDAFLVFGPDGVPPETTINSGPTGVINISSPTFTFSFEANSTFECSLDGAALGDCSPPQSYADLAIGPHTFEVRALDAAGNADPTPASRTWKVWTLRPTWDEETEGKRSYGTVDLVPFRLARGGRTLSSGFWEYSLRDLSEKRVYVG